MTTLAVHIPEKKRNALKKILAAERRGAAEVISGLIDEYIERHRETAEILSNPDWADAVSKGKDEVRRGVKGKRLHELAG